MAITKQLLANLKGPRGEQGIQGIQGVQGEKGDTGVIQITTSIVATFEELPTVGDTGTLYLVGSGGSGTNKYTEYVYVDSAYEVVGSTQIDLSNYYTKSEIDAMMGDVSTALTTILGA